MNDTPDDALDASHVRLAYRGMLRREPAPPEVAHQLGTLRTTAQLLDVIRGSAEYAALQAVPDPAPETVPVRRVNRWSVEDAPYCHPVGLLSDDEVTIVGEDGWLFLHGGNNSVLGQYDGSVAMPDGWADGWRALMEHRTAAMRRGGREALWMVLPDKLAVYGESFPRDLGSPPPRPVERLLDELGLPLLHPVDALRAARARGPVCLRTDTHFSFFGNHVVYAEVARALGVTPVPFEAFPTPLTYATSGDLGSRLEPAVVEIVHMPGDLGTAEVVADNRPAVQARGGHIGTRTVYRNAGEVDPRVVVLFGDSYGYGSEHYQGLAWFLAQSFAEVHFVWIPFGWDADYADRVDAQVVISETAERFLARVPATEVDVDLIVAAAVGDDDAVGHEAVFADHRAPAPGAAPTDPTARRDAD